MGSKKRECKKRYDNEASLEEKGRKRTVFAAVARTTIPVDQEGGNSIHSLQTGALNMFFSRTIVVKYGN